MSTTFLQPAWMLRTIVIVALAAAFGLSGAATAPAATVSVRAAADGYVSKARPGRHYGHASVLRAQRRTPVRRIYLRFKLGSAAGKVKSARLRLYARSSGPGLVVRGARSGRGWSERSLTFRNAPRPGARVGLVRGLRRGHWVSVKVTKALRGRKAVTLVLVARGRRAVRLGSRETGRAARLVILTRAGGAGAGGSGGGGDGSGTGPGGSGSSDGKSPTTPATLSVTGTTGSSIALSWSAATDNVGVKGYGYYLDGQLAGTTTTRTATIGGIPCGTTHNLAVDAFDAAGNRSGKRVTVASTAGCPLEPASVFVSPSGSDGNPCSAAAPCSSFQRAYQVAGPGQVVEVAGGSYPDQELSPDGSESGPGIVTFRPASGATVQVGNLRVEGAAFVTFRGIQVQEAIRVMNLDPDVLGSQNVSFEDMRAQTVKIVGRVANIAVRGGVYGDTVDWQPQIAKANQDDPESARPHNILIDGATFQNYLRSGSSVHTECLQVLNVDGLVVRNSRFNNCDGTGDIGVTDGPSDNLTFENNFLGKDGDAYYAIQLTKNTGNVVLRNNSMSKAMIFSDTESGGPWLFQGNYMPYNSTLCTNGATHRHNVYAGGTCDPSDLQVGAMQFVDADGFDLHLAPGSAARDNGDPDSYPSTDIDGQARPMGGAPDAGADEAG